LRVSTIASWCVDHAGHWRYAAEKAGRSCRWRGVRPGDRQCRRGRPVCGAAVPQDRAPTIPTNPIRPYRLRRRAGPTREPRAPASNQTNPPGCQPARVRRHRRRCRPAAAAFGSAKRHERKELGQDAADQIR
jgi:hypothetical protein